MAQDQYYILNSFVGGIKNRNMPLWGAPPNTLYDGKNVVISETGIATRPGYQQIDAGLRPAGTDTILHVPFTENHCDTTGNSTVKVYSCWESYACDYEDPGGSLTVGYGGGGEMFGCHWIDYQDWYSLSNGWSFQFDITYGGGSDSPSYQNNLVVCGDIAGLGVLPYLSVCLTASDNDDYFVVHQSNVGEESDQMFAININDNPLTVKVAYSATTDTMSLYVNTVAAWDGDNEEAETLVADTQNPTYSLGFDPGASQDGCFCFARFGEEDGTIGYTMDNCILKIPSDPTNRDIWTLEQVRLPTCEKTYLLAQTHDATYDGLLASNDQLDGDETSLTFTQLKAYASEPNRISLATMRDVVVATEGSHSPPQRWSGGMTGTSDRSDWERFIGVWQTYVEDGDWHDVTAEAVDRDADTYINASEAAEIIVATAHPSITAIGVEFVSGYENTGTGPGQSGEKTIEVPLYGASYVEREDVKFFLTRWVLDSTVLDLADKVVTAHSSGKANIAYTGHGFTTDGTAYCSIDGTDDNLVDINNVQILSASDANNIVIDLDVASTTNVTLTAGKICSDYFAGHFDDGAGSAYTLGPGNDAVWVEEGIEFSTSGGTVWITGILDDGEASEEVQITGYLATGAVTSMYALTLDDDSTDVGTADITATYTVYEADFSNDDGDRLGYDGWNAGTSSLRIYISSDDLSGPASADEVRVEFTCGYQVSYYGSPNYTSARYLKIKSAAIAKEGTATFPDTQLTPTQLLFGPDRAATWVLQNRRDTITVDDIEYARIPAPTSYYSNWVSYSYSSSDDIVVILDSEKWGSFSMVPWLVDADATWAWSKTDAVSYDTANVTEAEWTTVNGTTVAVSKIEVRGGTSFPSAFGYVVKQATSAATSLFTVESILDVEFDELKEGSSTIVYALEWNLNGTWYVWDGSGGGAWVSVVTYNSGTSKWQYYDGSSWNNAEDDGANTELRALFMALNDSDNIATATSTDYEGIGSFGGANHWLFSESGVGGWRSGYTVVRWAACLKSDGSNPCEVRSVTWTVQDEGSTLIAYYDGADWTEDSWTDGTEDSGVQFAQNGALTPDTSPSTAVLSTLNGIMAYFWRIRFSNVLSSDVRVKTLTYRSSIQDLKSLGTGVPEPPAACIYEHDTDDWIIDGTADVQDYTEASYLSLGIVDESDTEDIMAADCYVYIGGIRRFNQVQLVIAANGGNSNAATMTVEYHDGTTWQTLTKEDGTLNSGYSKTLARTGKLTWEVPSDWKTCAPIDGRFPTMYYVRLSVSAELSQRIQLAEVSLWLVPDDVEKHEFAEVWRDRLVLAKRPDGLNQVTLSAENQEYFLSALAEGASATANYSQLGGQSAHIERVGGPDEIIGMKEIQDRLLVIKPKAAYILSELSSGVPSFAQVEIGGNTPCNDRVIVSAPASNSDAARHAVWWIGQRGASVLTGISADNEYGVGRVQRLDRFVDWWDDRTTAGIYKPALYLACGEYWAPHNWIVWAVPWTTDGSAVTYNNRLLVFDLSLGAWLPPFYLSASALCQATHYSSSAPGYLGSAGLYAGDYQGFIYRLFHTDGDIDSDSETSAIACEAEWGWLDFGLPTIEKQINSVTVVWDGASDVDLTLTLYRNGSSHSSETTTATFSLGDTSNRTIIPEWHQMNFRGYFFKPKLTWTGQATIAAIMFNYTPDAHYPDMSTNRYA